MAVAETHDRHSIPVTSAERERTGGLSGERVLLLLIAVAGLSIALRIVLAGLIRGPWIFTDELGYHRLAHSLGANGELALFGEGGLSYSPLYSLVLAPIHALGASAPAAYEWTKVVNAVLMSLAVFPIYRIARYVLPRGSSLAVAALAATAPLMFYTALVMSESLAYPLFLLAIWAMLAAVRAPGPRVDALLLVAILAATAARAQLVVLYPMALTAVALAAALTRDGSPGVARRVVRALRQHAVLLAAGALVVVGALARGLAGDGVLSVAGRYANVGAVGFPSPWRVFEIALQHLAGLDLALGAIPFAGAIVAAYVLARRGARRDVVVFAAVAVSSTAWLLLEVAYNRAAFEAGTDLPRIHERYLFYVAPLFLVALVAVARLRTSAPPFGVYLAAAGAAALLPAAIPFEAVINNTIVADSFGLHLFGEEIEGTIRPLPRATSSAVTFAALLGLLYVVLRRRPRGVLAVVVVVFTLMSSLVGARMYVAAAGATEAVLPAQHDWVDRAVLDAEVALVGGDQELPLALRETAFYNFSITRLYYACLPAFGPEFGERELSVGPSGRLRDGPEPVRARYAVAPVELGLSGRVVARNREGRLVLVEPAGGRLSVERGRTVCP